MVYKYFLKAFYNKTNKKKYKSQIWQHNVRHTNIITMKDVIFLKKARVEKEKLSKITADIIVLAEVAQILNSIDLALRYR